MSAGERIGRRLVVEATGRPPCRGIVARLAVFPELVLVGVFMTGRAISVEPQPAWVGRLTPLRLTRNWTPVAGGVARCTLDRRVAAREQQAGATVVERRLALLVPVDEIEIAPGVLRVTAGAVFPLLASMKAAAFVHEPLDTTVACKTVFAYATIAPAMAHEAL